MPITAAEPVRHGNDGEYGGESWGRVLGGFADADIAKIKMKMF